MPICQFCVIMNNVKETWERRNMDILKRITDIRESRGMTIYELAKRSGINKNTIYRWYDKNFTPSLDSLQVICEKGFGMSLVEFFALGSELIPATPEIKEIIEVWTTLSDVQKQAVMQIIKSYKKTK